MKFIDDHNMNKIHYVHCRSSHPNGNFFLKKKKNLFILSHVHVIMGSIILKLINGLKVKVEVWL